MLTLFNVCHSVSLLFFLSATVQLLIYKNSICSDPSPKDTVVPDPTGFGGKKLKKKWFKVIHYMQVFHPDNSPRVGSSRYWRQLKQFSGLVGTLNLPVGCEEKKERGSLVGFWPDLKYRS